jgi:hypothetical protein
MADDRLFHCLGDSMKKLLVLFALLPTLCMGMGIFVNADEMDNLSGSKCKVHVSQYHSGSGIMYLGNCGWYGLKGPAAYVQAWNHSNHVMIVRGDFKYAQAQAHTKVTYINKVKNTIETYEEFGGYKENVKTYNFHDILADAVQAGFQIDSKVITYVKFANYIDTME